MRAEAKSAASTLVNVWNTDAYVVTRTNALEGGVTLNHLGLREERNERLVGGRLDKELQGVTIVGDSLQRANDRLQNCASSDYDEAVRYRYRQKKELDNALFPMPLMAVSEKTPSSWKLAQ